MNKLLPCPHCGDTGRIRIEPNKGYYVDCPCDSTLAFYGKEEHAIAAWNRRAPAPVPLEVWSAMNELYSVNPYHSAWRVILDWLTPTLDAQNKEGDYLLAHAPDPEPDYEMPEPPEDYDDEDKPHYDTPGGW